MTVYIPTMNRYDNLVKIVPAWLAQDFKVRLVVEGNEYGDHVSLRDEMGWKGRVTVVPVPRSGAGVGYARRYCVFDADKQGLKSVIMTDDDMKPARDSDMWNLIMAAEDDNRVLGIGAVRSIHDHFTGGAVSAHKGVILCPGGWGFQMFGLNIANALYVGNFDSKLHSYGEDGELARQGIKRGIPWAVHCDTWCSSIGKRYEPGGISNRFTDRAARTAAEAECLALIHKRWPAYTNPPDKPLRVAWQKLLNDFIPAWRERSAIHGGKW